MLPECEEKTALVWDWVLLGFPWLFLEMELQQDIQVFDQDTLGNRGSGLGFLHFVPVSICHSSVSSL